MGTRTEVNVENKRLKVANLSKEMEEFGAFLVFEYQGLTAEEIYRIRTKLKESSSKLVVHRNNELNRAMAQLKLEKPLSGPNALLLTRGDLKPFGEIIKLSKERETMALKMAYFDGEVFEGERLAMLSSLGTREEMVARLSRTLASPLYKLLYLLKNIQL